MTAFKFFTVTYTAVFSTVVLLPRLSKHFDYSFHLPYYYFIGREKLAS